MARASKEAVVFIIDTGPSMAEPYPFHREGEASSAASGAVPTKLEVAKEVATLLIADRAIDEQGKTAKCEAGMVAFGTDATCHSLQDLGPDYDHMVEVFPLEAIHAANLARAMALRPAQGQGEGEAGNGGNGVQGDVLSALILGFTLLQERTKNRKTDRRLVVLTDGRSPIATADGLEAVVEGLEEYGVHVTVVGLNFPHDITGEAAAPGHGHGHSNGNSSSGGGGGGGGGSVDVDTVVRENARMLQSVAHASLGGRGATAQALRRSVREAGPLLASLGANLRKRAASANSNLAMHLTPELSFAAQASAITMVARAPSLTLSSREDASHEKLVMERRYHDQEEGPMSAEVQAHERVRGFSYGGEVLPVDPAAEGALKWGEEEVSLRLITFLPSARVKRWHALGNALAIKPHAKDGFPRNALLLASLGQALRQTDTVALVRYHRRKAADPELGILTAPSVLLSNETGDVAKLGEGQGKGRERELPPYLVYNKMPFEEDIRPYSFRPLDASNARHYPTPKEKAAALDFVDALTLPTNPATGTALRLAPHPGIRAVWRAAVAKAVAAGVEDEEAEAQEAAEEEKGEEGMDEAEAVAAGVNAWGRDAVVRWGAALRAEQQQEQGAGDGYGAGAESLPLPVRVPFLSFPTEAGAGAGAGGEAAALYPPEMRRDGEMWARAEGRVKRFAEEFPLHPQEPKPKKQLLQWGTGAAAAAATDAAVAAAPASAALKAEDVGLAGAAAGVSLAMEEMEDEEGEGEEEAAPAPAPAAASTETETAGTAGAAAATAASSNADATYVVAGKAVPGELDRANLEETLALMLGAGGAHTTRALQQLARTLRQYVDRAEEGQSSYYKRAREALQAFRQASETAQRPPAEFNAFLRREVKQGLCHGGGAEGGELWRLLRAERLTLRGVGEAEARAFLDEAEAEEAAPRAPTPVAPPAEEEDEDGMVLE